jgi:uncharacterized protein
VKLLVDRLGESPTEHPFSASPAWWRELWGDDRTALDALDEPIDFVVRAHRMGSDVYLEGEASGSLATVCSRCLRGFRTPLHESFRLVLEPAGPRVPADPEGAAELARSGVWLGDELEAGWFRGSELDLARLFQEVVALALPAQPLCREDCRGLCPRCGVDRNVESCDCAEAAPPSAFAALGALRDSLSGGGKR